MINLDFWCFFCACFVRGSGCLGRIPFFNRCSVVSEHLFHLLHHLVAIFCVLFLYLFNNFPYEMPGPSILCAFFIFLQLLAPWNAFPVFVVTHHSLLWFKIRLSETIWSPNVPSVITVDHLNNLHSFDRVKIRRFEEKAQCIMEVFLPLWRWFSQLAGVCRHLQDTNVNILFIFVWITLFYSSHFHLASHSYNDF